MILNFRWASQDRFLQTIVPFCFSGCNRTPFKTTITVQVCRTTYVTLKLKTPSIIHTFLVLDYPRLPAFKNLLVYLSSILRVPVVPYFSYVLLKYSLLDSSAFTTEQKQHLSTNLFMFDLVVHMPYRPFRRTRIAFGIDISLHQMTRGTQCFLPCY